MKTGDSFAVANCIITVTKRGDDYHACITGHPEIWDAGKSQAEAVGNLIISHESVVQVTLIDDDDPDLDTPARAHYRRNGGDLP
jgi:hypothetical protein